MWCITYDAGNPPVRFGGEGQGLIPCPYPYHDASPWPGAGRTRQRLRSAVALHRFGTRPRLPTRAAMVRFLQPPLCASRKPPPIATLRGKSIHPLVGKRRAGPQRRRAGALHDAGAFPGRPFDFAALRHANWTVLGELSKAGQSGRSFWRFSFKRIGCAQSHLCARGRARSETLRHGPVLGERGTVFGVRWPSTALEHFPACQPERPWFVSSNRLSARAASLRQSPRSGENPFTRWLARDALGHSAGGPAHSTTLARFPAAPLISPR